MERISERSGRMSINQTNENSFNRARRDYHAVGKCIPKKDSSQLLLGKPVFTDDITASLHRKAIVLTAKV